MKTTHLKARYSLDELRKWAESPVCAEALKDAAEKAKKKFHELTLSQLCEPGRPRTFLPRSRVMSVDRIVFIDPQAIKLFHHYF